MPETGRKLRATDAAYCVAVSMTAVCMVVTAIARQHVSWPFLEPTVPVLVFSLAGLFIIGVGLQIRYRRFLSPLPVVACIAATGRWFAMILAVFVF